MKVLSEIKSNPPTKEMKADKRRRGWWRKGRILWAPVRPPGGVSNRPQKEGDSRSETTPDPVPGEAGGVGCTSSGHCGERTHRGVVGSGSRKCAGGGLSWITNRGHEVTIKIAGQWGEGQKGLEASINHAERQPGKNELYLLPKGLTCYTHTRMYTGSTSERNTTTQWILWMHCCQEHWYLVISVSGFQDIMQFEVWRKMVETPQWGRFICCNRPWRVRLSRGCKNTHTQNKLSDQTFISSKGITSNNDF